MNEHAKPVKGSKIGIIGVAYKPNVDDQRESPAFAVMEGLIERGAVISFHDPHINETRPMRSFDVPMLYSEELTPPYLSGLDAVVVITDHAAVDWNLIARHAKVVIDTRNVVPVDRGAQVVRA